MLSGVLVPPFGLLLELPWFTIPQALLIANILITSAHLAFFLRVAGCILPLSFLGIAYALYGVAFWAGLARSMLLAVSEEPSLDLENSTPVLTADEDEELDNEANSDGDTHHDPARDDLVTIGFGTATSLLNLSTALVPMLLAVVENHAGYSGLEMVFVALAGCGCLASMQLARMWSISQLQDRCWSAGAPALGEDNSSTGIDQIEYLPRN